MPFADSFRNKSVLITGHTGFKGSWLSSWLLSLGARVHGYALDPEPNQTLYDQLGIGAQFESDTRGDILDGDLLRHTLDATNPDYVFHLAAQSLVRRSYDIPVETFATNVMGTAQLLNAVRLLGNCQAKMKPRAVIIVTTDKCYENLEWVHAYREVDALGGFDPYSASKGCAEIVVSAFRNSYFCNHRMIRVASARAGNVIGGGDWANDRIVPDCFRALQRHEPIRIRNKTSTRPWQHVLEPLSGYLWLAACLLRPELKVAPHDQLSAAFNFGPSLQSNRTVSDVVEAILRHTPGTWVDCSDPNAKHEAARLNLSIDKAYHLLGWSPVWGFDRTVEESAKWYNATAAGDDARAITAKQVEQYCLDAGQCKIAWASK